MGIIAKGKHLLAALLLITSSSAVHAQQELEYKLELGGMFGGSFYLGDANYTSLYRNTHLAGAAIARYNINPRMALKFDLAYGGISGDASLDSNQFPDMESRSWTFDNSVVDLGCQYEICFWGYGTGQGYKGHRRFTPYIQAGLGFTYGGNSLTMNIPVGFGVKYKVRERVNIGLDWTMHFSMGDKLDGIKDPYHINSGFLKNKDSYSFTMLYISYDLMPKYRKCNND